jgi:hypothetical protein
MVLPLPLTERGSGAENQAYSLFSENRVNGLSAASASGGGQLQGFSDDKRRTHRQLINYSSADRRFCRKELLWQTTYHRNNYTQ